VWQNEIGVGRGEGATAQQVSNSQISAKIVGGVMWDHLDWVKRLRDKWGAWCARTCRRRAHRALVRQLAYQERKAQALRGHEREWIMTMMQSSQRTRAMLETVHPIPGDARVLEVGSGAHGLVFFFGEGHSLGVDPLALAMANVHVQAAAAEDFDELRRDGRRREQSSRGRHCLGSRRRASPRARSARGTSGWPPSRA
jgi:hypothetical protein